MCFMPSFVRWIFVHTSRTRWKSAEGVKGLQTLARLVQGCDPISCFLQPVPAFSEAACFSLAPVQLKVSPTTSCSLSSPHCLLEQRDYSPCILLDLCNGLLGFLALVRCSLKCRVGVSLCGRAHKHRIQVYLLAGQEVECEISMCGEGEGKESLGLCVKLLKCYWLGI